MDKFTFTDFITEAPLPDDWDAAMYNERVPFARRVRYAQERARRLGGGSSRIAFVIPYQGRDTVLKVAKNAKGMAQNEVEVSVLGDGYLSRSSLFIPMIDYDEANNQPTWIHTEMASKAKNSDFVKACGGTLEDLIAFAIKAVGRDRRTYIRGDASKIDPDSDLAIDFVDYIGNFDAPVNDYYALANWGIYQGRPVIIDAGLNSETMKLYARH